MSMFRFLPHSQFLLYCSTCDNYVLVHVGSRVEGNAIVCCTQSVKIVDHSETVGGEMFLQAFYGWQVVATTYTADMVK